MPQAAAETPRDAPAEPPPLPPVAQRARFCRGCGAVWEPQWAECPHCAPSAAAIAAAAAAPHARPAQSAQRAIMSAVWLYFALLGVSMALMIVLLAAGRDATAEEQMVTGAVFAAITTIWCVASRRDVVPLLARGAGAKWFVLAVAAAVPTFVIATAVVEVLRRSFDVPEIRYIDSFIAAGYGFGWVVLDICVQPGVFEELAFRGVIFGALERVLGGREALLVSALMFAILHLSIPSIPHLFLIGLVLGWLRMRTASLYPGMLMHFTHNLFVVLAEQYGDVTPW